MVTLQLEVVGDRVAIFLDKAACDTLQVQTGDLVHLRHTPEGELVMERAGADYEDRHGRGRAFLKRYQRSLEVFAPPSEGAARS
jgi:hypothetical protein